MGKGTLFGEGTYRAKATALTLKAGRAALESISQAELVL